MRRPPGLLAAVLLLLLTACGGDRSLQADPPGQPYRLPAAVLVSPDGPYDLRARTQGRDVLLYAGYTHCDDACPATVATVATALRDSDPQVVRRTTFLFLTSDPARDTPAVLRDWLGRFAFPAGADVVGLTGAPDALARAASALDLPLSTDEAVHATTLLGFDRSGVAKAAWQEGVRPRDLVHDLPLLESVAAPSAAPAPFVPSLRVGDLQLGDAAVRGTAVTLTVRGGPRDDVLLAVRPGTLPAQVAVPAGVDVAVTVALPGPAPEPGQVVPLQLRFRDAGAATLQVPVAGPR